jgi:UDP-N-acetylglucosamine 2-epimerase (non-hydrolysing)
MFTILSVMGTRPEAIKMAPVIRELERYPAQVRSVVCVTAQHRQMLDQVLEIFAVKPDYDLDVMRTDQSLTQVTTAVLNRLEPILVSEQPDWVLVQGDTTTTLAAALGAFYQGVRVGHVEAGLRTYDRRHPFPEEVNRRVVDLVAGLYFAPTDTARANLLREGTPDTLIHVTGNPGIDALLFAAQQSAAVPMAGENELLAAVPSDRRLILVTAHRRENFGERLQSICSAVRQLARAYLGDVHFVFPVHPNPQVLSVAQAVLGEVPNVTLTPPLDYLTLVRLLRQCVLFLTDSGGLQEEAPSLGVPVLILRDITERPEGVAAGTARLVGVDEDRIVTETRRLLDDAAAHAAMARAINPYGDGQAAERIVSRLLAEHGQN